MSKMALLFLTVFLGGIIAALVVSGTAAFMLYQVVYMLNPDARWWSASIPGLRYSFITVILMMIALAIRYKECSEKAPWKQQPMFKWLLLFLVMHYVMYLYALNPQLHQQWTETFTKLVVIIFIAYKLITSERALHAVLWTYIIGATYIGTVARSVGRDSGGRVEGIGMIDTGGDSNHTAAALVPAAVLLIYYAWMGDKKMKLFCVVCGAFIANALVLINSRGAFLAAVVGAAYFIFYMLFSGFQKPGQRFMAIFIIIAGLGGSLSLADEAFWERMRTLQVDESGERGGSGRMAFWWATVDMMEDYPMGLGIGGFPMLSEAYVDASATTYNTDNRVPHSSWFQVLGDLGWPGPVLFGAILLSLYRLSRRTKKFLIEQGRTDAYFQMLSLEAALLSYIVAATFIDRIRAEMFYWLFLFIAVAANVYYLQHIKNDKPQARASKKAHNTATTVVTKYKDRQYT